MFLLKLTRVSDENIFQDPYSEGVNHIWKSFQTEERTREEMLRDFERRFDADSDCTISDNRIEVRMIDGNKWIYSVSKL